MKLGNVLICVMQDLSRISTNGSAHIRVNRNICEPREFENLFNHFSRGTILEHIEIDVEPLQAHVNCGCGYKEKVDGDHSGYKRCPDCGKFAEVRDDPYRLVKPDPNRVGMRKSIRF